MKKSKLHLYIGCLLLFAAGIFALTMILVASPKSALCIAPFMMCSMIGCILLMQANDEEKIGQ